MNKDWLATNRLTELEISKDALMAGAHRQQDRACARSDLESGIHVRDAS